MVKLIVAQEIKEVLTIKVKTSKVLYVNIKQQQSVIHLMRLKIGRAYMTKKEFDAFMMDMYYSGLLPPEVEGRLSFGPEGSVTIGIPVSKEFLELGNKPGSALYAIHGLVSGKLNWTVVLQTHIADLQKMQSLGFREDGIPGLKDVLKFLESYNA